MWNSAIRLRKPLLAGMFFSSQAIAAQDMPVISPFSRQDSLFLAAATGEPRFQGLRDSSEKALLAEDTATMRYLLARRLDGQTPRQRQTVQKLFTQLSDSGRNASPRVYLESALAQAHDTLRVQLLYIGSKLGDSAFRRIAIPFLRSDSGEVRRMALRCLGAYPHPSITPLLWERLDSARGLELQQCLWALQAQGKTKAWRKVVPLLRDRHGYNRRAVRDLMLSATDSSWTRLRQALPPKIASQDLLEWCLMARDSKGADSFLRGALPRLPEQARQTLKSQARIARNSVVK